MCGPWPLLNQFFASRSSHLRVVTVLALAPPEVAACADDGVGLWNVLGVLMQGVNTDLKSLFTRPP